MDKSLFILAMIAMILLNWATWMFVGFLCLFTKYFSWMYHVSPFISFGFMICIITFGYRFYKTLKG